ncbi:hypothetical protein [Agrococcus beijingensis]|uniref:hypothetical protein n=1 Tax=Agrococcus beijingensis TaxID=3068634 RepID=UPI0027419F4C|nr:hypothetical protein [Agrococcus sp. REN33]
MALGVAGVGAVTVASAAPPSATLSVEQIETEIGQATVDWPAGVAAAAFEVEGIEGATGFAGDTGSRPMASVAKLLFAAVLLDARPLAPGEAGPSITLSERDVAHLAAGVRQGASVLPVAVGDVLTQRQLLEAAMLISASNATMTLADWAWGSHDGYLAAAGAWLDEQGIVGLEVADATGLSARGVATTAGLLDLMDAVDARPALREISGTATATLPRIGLIENTNEALGSAGIDSGKTGNLYAHGRTVLVSATRVVGGTPVRVRVALLGIQPGVDRGAVTAALVDSVATNLQWLTVLPADAEVAHDVPWGAPVELETTSAIHILHWRGTPVRVAVHAPAAWDPDAAASLDLQVGDTSRSVALAPSGAPTEPSLDWRLQRAAEALAKRL